MPRIGAGLFRSRTAGARYRVGVRKRARLNLMSANARRRMRSMKLSTLRRMANQRTAGFLGIEYKFLDCTWLNVSLTASSDASSAEVQPTAGCTSAISIPAQGDGESQRDGRKYTIKSAYVSGVISFTADGDLADPYQNNGCFAALVLDTQANGATIVSEQVYTNTGGSGLQYMPQPLRNLQYSKRYRILDSKYIPSPLMYAFTDGASTGSVSAQTTTPFSLSWKGNLVCDSTGTAASVASAADNAIHLLIFNAGGLPKTFFGKSRVRFLG